MRTAPSASPTTPSSPSPYDRRKPYRKKDTMVKVIVNLINKNK